MKRRIGALVDLLMGRGPAAWLGRMWNRRRLVVLAYHGVDDRSSFAGHLDQLTKSYNVVSLDEVLASTRGASLPSNSVLITFDDGERTVLTEGLPELLERSLPSVLFAIADFVDSDRPFWWYETEDLVSHGAASPTLGDVGDAASVVGAMKRVSDDVRLSILEELRQFGNRRAVEARPAHCGRTSLPRPERHGRREPFMDTSPARHVLRREAST